MGHVNHAVYFTYFEQCRLAWWHSLGGPEAFPGVSTIVVHAECDYRAPAFMHEEIEIRASVAQIGRTSLALTYEIANVSTAQKLADGRTVSVTVDPRTHQPVPVPEATRALFAESAKT